MLDIYMKITLSHQYYRFRQTWRDEIEETEATELPRECVWLEQTGSWNRLPVALISAISRITAQRNENGLTEKGLGNYYRRIEFWSYYLRFRRLVYIMSRDEKFLGGCRNIVRNGLFILNVCWYFIDQAYL